MSFKNLRAKKAKKNEAVIVVDGLGFHCKRVSFASPDFLAMFKAFVSDNGWMEKFNTPQSERWLVHSLMGSYEDDVTFLSDFIVTGWEGFENDKGEAVKYSPEAFKEFFLTYDNDFEKTGLEEIIASLLTTLNTPSIYSVTEDDLKNS